MIYPRLSVVRSIFLAVTLASKISAYSSSCLRMNNVSPGTFQHVPSDRRAFLSKAAAMSFGAATASKLTPQFGGEAQAVGPVKLNLVRPVYSASICPKDKPIPGEKAMKGMRGLCVTVQAFLEESAPKVMLFSYFSYWKTQILTVKTHCISFLAHFFFYTGS